MDSFCEAVITKCHELSGLHNRNVLPHGSWGGSLRLRCWEGCAVPESSSKNSVDSWACHIFRQLNVHMVVSLGMHKCVYIMKVFRAEVDCSHTSLHYFAAILSLRIKIENMSLSVRYRKSKIDPS